MPQSKRTGAKPPLKRPVPRARLFPRRLPNEPDDPEAESRIRRILASPSYRRADQDLGFLARNDVRASRLQLEYLKPELILTESQIASTMVVFGGTRIVEPAAAKGQVDEARKILAGRPDDPECQRQLRVAERILAKSHYYDVAREFARIVSCACQVEDRCEFVVVTGGGPGIMEAANRGAFEAGAKSIGFNITLPEEQVPNSYIAPELCFQFRYFALRKMHFLQRAKALVAFPGGYGTLDELFDALCLLQTRKIASLPIVLVGEEFWRNVIDFDFLVQEGVIDPEDAALFCFAQTAQEIWHRIKEFWRRNGEEIPSRSRNV
jgi:hypothetical protein